MAWRDAPKRTLQNQSHPARSLALPRAWPHTLSEPAPAETHARACAHTCTRARPHRPAKRAHVRTYENEYFFLINVHRGKNIYMRTGYAYGTELAYIYARGRALRTLKLFVQKTHLRTHVYICKLDAYMETSWKGFENEPHKQAKGQRPKAKGQSP